MNQKEKRWIGDIGVLLLIMILVLVVGLQNIKLPGIYFDSAITDYLAALVVHPAVGNTETTMSHVGLPLLGSIYHGSFTMFLQMILLTFFEPSAFTLRLPYLLYYAFAVFILYKIIYAITDKKTAITASVIISGMMHTITLTRTQYDIMLPGVVFFLASIYLLISKMDVWNNTLSDGKKTANKYSFLMGLLIGLAFYCYFCFIFYLPITMVLLWILQKNNRVWSEISHITGVLAGSSLYFIGYADSLFTNIMGEQTSTLVLLIVFCILFYAAIGIPAYCFLKERQPEKWLERYYYIAVISVVLGGGIPAYKTLSRYPEQIRCKQIRCYRKKYTFRQ